VDPPASLCLAQDLEGDRLANRLLLLFEDRVLLLLLRVEAGGVNQRPTAASDSLLFSKST
jgi:hypothetical protein